MLLHTNLTRESCSSASLSVGPKRINDPRTVKLTIGLYPTAIGCEKCSFNAAFPYVPTPTLVLTPGDDSELPDNAALRELRRAISASTACALVFGLAGVPDVLSLWPPCALLSPCVT